MVFFKCGWMYCYGLMGCCNSASPNSPLPLVVLDMESGTLPSILICLFYFVFPIEIRSCKCFHQLKKAIRQKFGYLITFQVKNLKDFTFFAIIVCRNIRKKSWPQKFQTKKIFWEFLLTRKKLEQKNTNKKLNLCRFFNKTMRDGWLGIQYALGKLNYCSFPIKEALSFLKSFDRE